MSIISSETNPLVLKRAEKLKIHCINSVSDKAVELKKNIERLNITEQNLMFVGNDINDIPAFKLARYSVGVADCHSEIEKYIDFKLSKAWRTWSSKRVVRPYILNSFKLKTYEQ
jgi:3-deoxy-D-manno-octulosonate 8-phosphate phosphatase (KDO 8-P phosphatase)